MHYIYIHRYTINYNKVREAHLISPRFHFHLSIRYSLSFKYGLVNFLACFCNTCYNTELGGRFFFFFFLQNMSRWKLYLCSWQRRATTIRQPRMQREIRSGENWKTGSWEEERVHDERPGHSLTQGERTDGAYNRWMVEALWKCLKVLY